MKVKSESEVSQSCPTLRDPMDCSLPGSSVHGIFQARLGLNPSFATFYCVTSGKLINFSVSFSSPIKVGIIILLRKWVAERLDQPIFVKC